MPLSTYQAPGIYMEEVSAGTRPIEAVGTSTAGFVGVTPNGQAYRNEARAINNWSQFVKEFVSEGSTSTPLSHAVYGYFLNGGRRCYVVNVGPNQPIGGGRNRTGLDVLETIDEVAIVAIPGFADVASYEAALTHCENLKDRVAVLDAPEDVKDIDLLTKVGVAPQPARPARNADASPPPAPPPAGLRPGFRTGVTGRFIFRASWYATRSHRRISSPSRLLATSRESMLARTPPAVCTKLRRTRPSAAR